MGTVGGEHIPLHELMAADAYWGNVQDVQNPNLLSQVASWVVRSNTSFDHVQQRFSEVAEAEPQVRPIAPGQDWPALPRDGLFRLTFDQRVTPRRRPQHRRNSTGRVGVRPAEFDAAAQEMEAILTEAGSAVTVLAGHELRRLVVYAAARLGRLVFAPDLPYVGLPANLVTPSPFKVVKAEPLFLGSHTVGVTVRTQNGGKVTETKLSQAHLLRPGNDRSFRRYSCRPTELGFDTG